jgi:hypothetical protein
MLFRMDLFQLLRFYQTTTRLYTDDYHTWSFTCRMLRGVMGQRHRLWLSKNGLRDSSSWSSPPILLLRYIHCKFLTLYDCEEVCVSSQSQVNVGASVRLRSQDYVSQ